MLLIKNERNFYLAKLSEVVDSNQLVNLSDVIDIPIDSVVCIIHDYQDRLEGVGPYEATINKYLDSIGFVSNERNWWFITVVDDRIEMIRIIRTSDRTFTDHQSVVGNYKKSLPPGFIGFPCAPAYEAVLARVKHGNIEYIVLGREDHDR